MKNHFEILRVKPTDSDKKVFLSYRSLSSKNHPDNEKTKLEWFLQIHESYEVLRSKERRKFFELILNKPENNSEKNTTRLANYEYKGRLNGELYAKDSRLFYKKVIYFAVADMFVDFLGTAISGEILDIGLLLGLIISVVGFVFGINVIFNFSIVYLLLCLCLMINGILIIRNQLIKHAMKVGT